MVVLGGNALERIWPHDCCWTRSQRGDRKTHVQMLFMSSGGLERCTLGGQILQCCLSFFLFFVFLNIAFLVKLLKLTR